MCLHIFTYTDYSIIVPLFPFRYVAAVECINFIWYLIRHSNGLVEMLLFHKAVYAIRFSKHRTSCGLVEIKPMKIDLSDENRVNRWLINKIVLVSR